MIDVQKGLDIQNISDLVRRDIQAIYETKNLQKKKKKENIKGLNKK